MRQPGEEAQAAMRRTRAISEADKPRAAGQGAASIVIAASRWEMPIEFPV